MSTLQKVLNDSMNELEKSNVSYIDWELVFYTCFVEEQNQETKNKIGKKLLNANVVCYLNSQEENLGILKNSIKEDLGISKILK